MGALNTTNPTYLDVAKRLDPDGNISAIVEIVSQENAVMQDAVAIEGNLPTGNRSTQRTGLPAATWRLLNQGVPNGKSTTVQVDDQCGMLEAYAEVDLKLAQMSNNQAQFVASEDAAFLESMSQTMEDTFFNGNTTVNPERFLGMAARYDKVGTGADRTVLSYNVLEEAADANSSVYLVNWSPRTTFLIYPKGSMGGFKRTFLGQQPLSDATGQYEGLRTHYSWDVGLCVRDWRANVRMQVKNHASTGSVEETLITGINRQRGASGGRNVMYMSPEVHTNLEIRAMTKTNVNLTITETPFGAKLLSFRGIPIRKTDAIGVSESNLPHY